MVCAPQAPVSGDGGGWYTWAMPAAVEAFATPNPNARKYVLVGKEFARPLNVASVQAAAAHPLAQRLFALEGVYNVFVARDFVTVNKRPDVAWEVLEPQVLDAIGGWLESLHDAYSEDA